MHRILLVQTSFLGDTILSTPVIAGVHKLHPGAELWTLTTALSAQLLNRDPLITKCLVFDKRASERGLGGLLAKASEIRSLHFSKAYVLHRSARTALLMALARVRPTIGFQDASLGFLYRARVQRMGYDHEVLRNLSILSREGRIEEMNSELRLFAPRREEVSPHILNSSDAVSSYVVLVPGSAWKTKMWHWEGYRELAQYLTHRNRNVFLLGSQDDRTVAERVSKDLPVTNLVGQTSIGDMLYLIQRAALVVCNDSMSLHVASAFKVPSVAVFCSTSPRFGFGPWKNRAVVVEREGLACKPCGRHGFHECPLHTERCMREVPLEQVIHATERLLGPRQIGFCTSPLRLAWQAELDGRPLPTGRRRNKT